MFISSAAFQIGWGVLALLRPMRNLAIVDAVVNAVAFAFWLATRLTAVGVIDGLEEVEPFAVIDTICGLLALASGTLAGFAVWKRDAQPKLLGPAPIGALTMVLALVAAGSGVVNPHEHEHEHGHGTEEVAGHSHGDDDHDDHDDHADASSDGAHEHTHSEGAAATAVWPRPWDPAKPIDLSGVPGVTKAQETFGVNLIKDTMRDLPTYAKTSDAIAAGYRSINDSATGVEHYLNWAYTRDGKFLDSKRPESLVYEAAHYRHTTPAPEPVTQ